MNKYFFSVKAYFANEYLKDLFFNNYKEFNEIVFARDENKTKKLFENYFMLREEMVKAVTEQKKKNPFSKVTYPYDCDMNTVEDNFSIKYLGLQCEEPQQGLVAFIGMPKPMIEGECWAILTHLDFITKSNSYYTLDFDGYVKDAKVKDFLHAKLKLSEWKSATEKNELLKTNNMHDVMSYLSELKNSQTKIL